MTRITFSALLISSLLGFSSATLQVGITKNHEVEQAQLKHRALSRRSLNRRAGTVTAQLGNAVTAGLYFANVSVGTPAQALQLQIDTGSSDVWVPSSSASICSNAQEGGCPGGDFTSSKSSTFDVVGRNEFNISYVDGSGSTGDYFQDTFSIGGSTLDQFEMGLATDTSIDVGIMGIGYETSEANLGTGNGSTYPNLPVALVNQGKINSVAYSLWLNDLQATSGQVLFGGIDTKQYIGDLTSVQIYPDQTGGVITSFTVAWTSLSASSSTGTDQLTASDFAQPAILDSGTTITLLPDDIATKLFTELGAYNDERLGAVVVPCSLADKNGTINYGFGGVGGPTIEVQVSQLVLPLTSETGQTPTFTNGEAACQLGIQSAGEDPTLFGDTFLRSAYVVYDLSNNRIALAQTDFNSTDTNIVPFPSSGAAIPSATSAPNEAAVTQTATGLPRVGGATATGTGAATYNPTATGLSAASGFTATSTSAKKSAAGSGPTPFEWARVFIAGVCVVGAGMGGALFTLM